MSLLHFKEDFERRFLSLFITATLVVGLVLILPWQAQAQVLYGTLVGNVTDASGAAVPGATVKITQTQTGATRSVVTDQAGSYSIPTISAGTYTVEVSKTGFKTFRRAGVAVTLNSVARVNVSLEVGSVTQTVDVTAAAPLLQTDRADVHHDLAGVTLVNVPLPPGNNLEYMFGTIPGIDPPTTAHSIPTNPSRSLDFSANGASDYGNDVRVDGVSQVNIWVPENTAYVPSTDAVETVNVVTNNFDAEQGLAGGSTVNVQVKSGTNQLHGDVYEYHYDNGLKAHDFFDHQNGITRVPKDVFNQFGGSVGGPIKKDKLFYFSNVEFNRERQFATSNATVPTPAMMLGDLEGNDPTNGLAANADIIYDPTTGNSNGTGRTQIFATNNPTDTAHYNPLCASATCPNMIPTSRISPVATKLLNLLQQAPGQFLPSGSTKAPSNNYLAATDFAFNRVTTDDKIDWNATQKFTMFGHLGLLNYNDLDPQMFGAVGGPQISGYGGNEGQGSGHTITFSVTGNYVATPNFVVDANFGMTRMVTNSQQLDLNKNEGLDVLGIPGTNGTRKFEGSWPHFGISNFTDLGTHNNFMPYFRNDPQFLYGANASWIHGNHTLRFGGTYYVLHLNQQQPEWNGGGSSYGPQGGFGFGSGPTQLKCSSTVPCSGGKASGSSATNAYNNFATFLLGLATDYGKNIMVPDEFHTVTHQMGLYVSDQWRTTSKLTTTLGVRWEYYPMPTRGGTRGMERFDFANNAMMLCGVGGNPTNCGTAVSDTMFAPRIGLAYRLTPTFVIRAGYGITNEPYNLADDLRTNYPVLIPLFVTANSFQAATSLDSIGQANGPVGSSLPIGIPLPATPCLTCAEDPIPGNVALATTPSKLQRGYIQSWNFMLEKELPQGWVAQAGYVATRSIREIGFQDLNAQSPIAPTGCVPGSSGSTECGGTASQPLNYNASVAGACPSLTTTNLGCRTAVTSLITPIANDIYDSLQSTLKHQWASGYQVLFSYTWSKTIGMAHVSDEKSSAYIQTPAFYYLNRGLSPWDRPQNIEAVFIAQPPFGAGKRWASAGVPSKILGGWQWSGILQRVSGSLFEIHAGGTSSTNLNATGASNTQRPDLVKSSINVLNQYGKGTTWFDTSAFAVVTDTNRFGTSPFYPLHGPPMFNLDMALARDFKLTERFNFQFRVQAINFTNTPHFGSPNGDLNSSSFGQINGYANIGREVGDGRQLEFNAKLSF